MREDIRVKKWKTQEKKVKSKIFLTFFFFISSFFICIHVISAQTPDNLSSALARAQEARRNAIDFEGNSYFPGEWEAAESKFTGAGLLPKDSSDAIKAYNEAGDAFDRVFELTVPLFSQAREDEIMAIREYMVTLGARSFFPEFLIDADRAALLALTQYEAKDYLTARDSAAIALQKFMVLETAFNAWLLRVEILARGFAGYDPEQFDLGGEIINGAMDAYTAGDLKTARKKAEEALAMYNTVLSTSWASYAELRASLAEGERLAALDMKTDVTAKEFFKKADSDNKTALALLESKKYEDAARLFIDAEAMFVIASITALEQKRAAAAYEAAAYEAAYEAAYKAQSLEGPESSSLSSPNVLPAVYTVRPWSVSKDCFWNIAGFPWVYGDPHQWQLLYNANKSKLPDPDNPNVIEPGTVLDIPSIKGELRQGAWESGRTYEPLR